jgi:hypothetical protein
MNTYLGDSSHINELTSTNTIINGSVVFYAVRVLSKENLWASLYINELTSKNTIINGSVVFYAVRVLSKENLWASLCSPLLLLLYYGPGDDYDSNDEYEESSLRDYNN